jgi:hypothetical protein
VKDRRGNFLLEYSGGDSPEAISFGGQYKVRDFSALIEMPEGVHLRPCDGKNASSGLEPVEARSICRISNGGLSLVCKNLNLATGKSLTYKFQLVGWNSPDETKACPSGD